MHGQFVWYELTTPDVAGSKSFYPRVTQWGTMPFDDNYTMWTTGGAPFAGIFTLTEEMKGAGVPPNWMAYIEADDVDATLAKAEALGGHVVAGPDDIPGTGRFGVVKDPQGAMFGVYKSVRDSGSWDGNPVPGRFSWHELMTTDYNKAGAFYGELFGWAENGAMDMGNGMMYSMFGHGDQMYGGMYNRTAEMASQVPFWLLYINVKDVAKAVKDATKAGATVWQPQMDIPGGSIAILADPQGAAFAVHEVRAQPATAAAPTATQAAKKAAKKVVRRAKKAVSSAKAAVGKAITNATKAVKGAVKKVRTKTRPAAKKKVASKVKPKVTVNVKSKAVAKVKSKVAAKTRPLAKAANKARPKAKAAARKVVAKTRTKGKVAAGRFRSAAKKKR